MILPVVAYGDPVLKKRASSISKDYPNINSLISDMYDTMYGANGVGLAAPQIGLSIRLIKLSSILVQYKWRKRRDSNPRYKFPRTVI